MTVTKHIDFEPAYWGEFAAPPRVLPSYAQRVMALNPAAYWRMGEAGGTTASDEKNLRPGTYVGSPQLNQTGALFRDPDPAATFNGTNNAVSFTDTTLLNPATACSIVFWMNYRAPAVTADGAVLSRWANATGGWIIWVDLTAGFSGRSRTLSFAVDTNLSTGRVEGSTDLVNPGTFDAYAVTFVGGESIRLYKNGQLDQEVVAGVPTTMRHENQPLYLARSAGSIGHLHATLDEVAVFNHTLTGLQIHELHQQGVGQLTQPPTGGQP